MTANLQRTRADFENFRKQTEAQKEQAIETAKMMTAIKFLPILDDVERAAKAFPEQIEPILKTVEKTAAGVGLEKIETKVGTEFNPDLHEAVMFEDGEGEKELVTEILREGYYYEGKVVRTAMVKVGKA